MVDEVLPVIAAAACVMVLMLTAILLVRRRMRRGEIVQATVRRVDLDNSVPDFPVAVTLTYAFPWQGRTLEICQPPRQGKFCRLRRGSGRRCDGTPSAAACGNCPPAGPRPCPF